MSEPLRCRAPAVPTIQLEDAQMRVTRWDFAPGAETGWHRHAHDYVVVPMTGGELLLETPEGPRTAPLTPGQSYTRHVGVEHNVINPTAHEVVFVEIELR